MPVPNSIDDLNTDPNLNSPPGTEQIGNQLDNYIRTAFAFIKQVSDNAIKADGSDPVEALTIKNSAADSTLKFQSNSGQYRYVDIQTGTTSRWTWGVDNSAENGSNSGSDFFINYFKDDGTLNGNAVAISRATGITSFSKAPQSEIAPSNASDLTRKDYVDAATTAANNNANTRVLKSGDDMSGHLHTYNVIDQGGGLLAAPELATILQGRGSPEHTAGMTVKEQVGTDTYLLLYAQTPSGYKEVKLHDNNDFEIPGNLLLANGNDGRISTSGNIYGSVWGGWLADWLTTQFATKAGANANYGWVSVWTGSVENTQNFNVQAIAGDGPYILVVKGIQYGFIANGSGYNAGVPGTNFSPPYVAMGQLINLVTGSPLTQILKLAKAA